MRALARGEWPSGPLKRFITGAAVGAWVAGLLWPEAVRTNPPGAVSVSFGQPTKLARLHCGVLYAPKPSPNAVLLY